MDRRRLIACAFLLILTASARAVAQGAEPARPENPVLGSPATITPMVEEGQLLWLDPGTRIRRSPSVESPSIAVVDVRIEVPIVERRGSWILVRYGDWKGWVATDATPSSTRGVPSANSPDGWQLARAYEALGKKSKPAKLGPFKLFTDVTDRKLLRFLGRIVEQLPSVYRDRYGVDPGAEAREAAVIFSRQADYRDFARSSNAIGSQIHGHTSKGMAVVFVGRQSPDEVGAILVHELTHLLNRRVLKTKPYPWLEEGMGNDLAFCRIDDETGQLRTGSLGGRSVVIEHPIYLVGGWSRIEREIRLKGPVASLSLLRERQRNGRTVSLDLLLDLLWDEFVDPDDLQLRYDQSAFFVRYLLDGENGRLASPFRSYLRSLASGQPAEPSALLARLGLSWEDLEHGFGVWLQKQGVRR